MKTTAASLEMQLASAEARCYDNDWIVRMNARKEVETLKKRLANAKRREQKAAA